jgi:hypothetical protein
MFLIALIRYIGVINLVSVDFFICFIISPLQIVREINNLSQPNNTFLSSFTCSLIKSLSIWACFSSIFGLTLISLERFLVFKNNRHLERARFISYVAFSHTLAFLFATVNFCFNHIGRFPIHVLACVGNCTNVKRSTTSQTNTAVDRAEMIYRVTFTLIGYLCILITSYCYYVIYQIIRTKQFIRLRLNGLITIKGDPSTSHLTESKKLLSSTLAKKASALPQRAPFGNSRNISKSNASLEYSKILPSQNITDWTMTPKLSFSDSHLNSLTIHNTVNIAKRIKLNQFDSLAEIQHFKVSTYNVDKTSESDEGKVTIISLKNNLNSAGKMDKVDDLETGLSKCFAKRTRSRDKSMQFINRSGTMSMESKAIKKTLIPIVVFYTFWMPFAITKTGTFFIETSFLIELAYWISVMIAFCHSSFNPIVYCITNVNIREAMWIKLKKIIANNSLLNLMISVFKRT